MQLQNYEFFDNGNPVVGAAVYVRDATVGHPNTGTVLASGVTDANGLWSIAGLTDSPKDVEVVWGSVSQYHKWYKGYTLHGVYDVFIADVARFDDIGADPGAPGAGALVQYNKADAPWVRAGAGAAAQIATLPIITANVAANAITQIASQTTGFSGTRTVATFADVDSTNGKVSLTTTGGKVLVIATGYSSNSTASVVQNVALREDSGGDVASLPAYSFVGAAGFPIPFTLVWVFSSTAAAHSWYLRHVNASAAGTMTTNGVFMAAIEFKR